MTEAPTLTVEFDPPATGASGRRESPYSKRTRSSGTPSWSARFWAWAVAVPMPISWAELWPITEPSARISTRAADGNWWVG